MNMKLYQRRPEASLCANHYFSSNILTLKFMLLKNANSLLGHQLKLTCTLNTDTFIYATRIMKPLSFLMTRERFYVGYGKQLNGIGNNITANYAYPNN